SDCRFMRLVSLDYLNSWRRVRSIWGRHLSLPGSVEQKEGYMVGEISGFSAQNTPWWLRLFQLNDPEELTKMGFDEKFERALDSALQADLKVITAVPSWILTLFHQALERTGKEAVSDIWPNLHLMVCGGVKLAGYRSHLEKLYGSNPPDFIETYGASEGYFAFGDCQRQSDLRLVYDNDIFFEFVPDPLPDMESLSIQPSVPLWQVETGQPYAMLVTTNAGLWRYAVNDIIRFTATAPPRIEVLGRLSEMLDTYGEGLYLYEAEQALNKACDDVKVKYTSFTVGSDLESERETPRHYWFVQFSEPVHTERLQKLQQKLDEILQEINRHYAIRRESRALNSPVVKSIDQQDINSWMDVTNRKQAQGKLPSILTNSSDIAYFKSRS
ncbi:MAG: GH3 auxin-responsive promoter family protein, partial [Balneolaceae bacterium]|nr:GH3 auxin-responsive promoter family protein [Balneolaceae bacterium]